MMQRVILELRVVDVVVAKDDMVTKLRVVAVVILSPSLCPSCAKNANPRWLMSI